MADHSPHVLAGLSLAPVLVPSFARRDASVETQTGDYLRPCARRQAVASTSATTSWISTDITCSSVMQTRTSMLRAM